MRKETAVEWLVHELDKQMIERDKFDAFDWIFQDLIKQAETMEKEQIIESYCQGCFDISKDENIFPRETSEQYYKETYKQVTNKN